MDYIIEKDGTKRKAKTAICKHCEKEFLIRADFIDKAKFCSKDCANESFKNRKNVICSYCGKLVEKKISDMTTSKSGLYFCDRECKQKAQSKEFGLKEITPSHYHTGESDYRTLAFEKYVHQCAVCKWDEDERILDVHHIDSNRKNNNINNLVILCPICHTKITRKLYILTEDNKLIKKGE